MGECVQRSAERSAENIKAFTQAVGPSSTTPQKLQPHQREVPHPSATSRILRHLDLSTAISASAGPRQPRHSEERTFAFEVNNFPLCQIVAAERNCTRFTRHSSRDQYWHKARLALVDTLHYSSILEPHLLQRAHYARSEIHDTLLRQSQERNQSSRQERKFRKCQVSIDRREAVCDVKKFARVAFEHLDGKRCADRT